MVYANRVLLTFMLFVYTVPVEHEVIAENEVSPAPPLHLSNYFEKNSVTCMDEKEESSNSDLMPNEDMEIHSDADLTKEDYFKRKRSQPVCEYGVAEIFLFQSFADIQCQIPIKDDAPTVPKENVENTRHQTKRDEDVAKEKNEPKESIQTHYETEPNMKLEVADIQSFEEWKHLKLKEKDSRVAETISTSMRTVRAKKTQVNYASQDCGAKVLAHNKEAKHVSAILDENKDMYMLNPCSTSIWFVIELCEPIQVQQLQLGNLELFSSAPKEFSVSVSERYPAREWHTIGTFEASNERYLQTFTLKPEGLMFAKYVKFEMLSHFSNEHFCPLTLVRVLGVTMVDEFDESEQSNLKEEISDEDNTVETHRGIIVEETAADGDGPINTVLNIVKSAMGLNNGADQAGQGKHSQVKSNNSEEIDSYETEPIDPTAESEVVLVTNEADIAGLPGNSSFITLVQAGQGEDLAEYFRHFPVSSAKKIPLYFPHFIKFFTPISVKLDVNMCWFFEFFCKVSFAGCLVHYPYNFSAIGLFLPLSSFSRNFMTVLSTSHANSEKAKSLERAENVFTDSLQVSEQQLSEVKTSAGGMPFPGADLDLGTLQKEEAFRSHAGEDNQETVETNLATSMDESAAVDAHGFKPSLAASQEIGTLQLNIGKGEKAHESSATAHIESNVEPASETEPVATAVETTNGLPPTETDKANYSDTVPAVSDESSTDSTVTDSQPTQPPVVINPGTNQKDSVFMRLSNRIRVLEQNMSLSSDYLENLSQRYKKQMDEMQRAFNQTTSKLLTTSRTANENDEKQTELIQQAQVEITKLTQQLENLSLSHDRLHLKLVERHMCLIILEIIIFMAVLVSCIGRRMAQVRGDIERAEAMIERLENQLAEVHQNFVSDRNPNGHCSSTSRVSANYHLPPPSINVTKHGKKQKRKSSGQKNKGAELNSTTGMQDYMLQNKKGPVVHGQGGVEEIKNKSNGGSWVVEGGESCTNDKRQNWNENPLALKIPNGHVKDRK